MKDRILGLISMLLGGLAYKLRATRNAFDDLKERQKIVKGAAKFPLWRSLRILLRDLQGIWYRHPWEFVPSKYSEMARERLGHPGRMISGSKSRFHVFKPWNIPVFNSNLIIGKRKAWYGDLDLTESMDELVAIARETGQTVSVLRESDGRFEFERKPRLDKFVVRIVSKGDVNTIDWDEYHRDKVDIKLDGGKYRYTDESAISSKSMAAAYYLDSLTPELRKLYGIKRKKKGKKDAKKRAKVVRGSRKGS
jgi:hypothetical protein